MKINNENQLIIFVYNADSDFFSLVKDFFHKAFKPSTYDCRLCGVTYSFRDFGMKKEWKHFLNQLNIPSIFLHRDEFNEEYPSEEAEFPCAYIKKDETQQLFISQEQMNNLKNLEELKDLTLQKGKEYGISLKT